MSSEFLDKLRSLSFLPAKTQGKTVIEQDSNMAVRVDTADERQDVTVMPKRIERVNG